MKEIVYIGIVALVIYFYMKRKSPAATTQSTTDSNIGVFDFNDGSNLPDLKDPLP